MTPRRAGGGCASPTTGAGFRGFAAQPGQPTVAGALAEASPGSPGLDGPPRLTCAGRTDAGVHALGQVVHVDLPGGRPTVDLVPVVNRQLAPGDRRAGGRAGRPGLRRPPLGHRPPLPLPGLERPGGRPAARPRRLARAPTRSTCGPWPRPPTPLLGEHDFRAFCRRPPGHRCRRADRPSGHRRPLVRGPPRGHGRPTDDGDGTEAAVARAGAGAVGESRLLRFDIEAYVVLPPDGPVRRRHPGRRRPRRGNAATVVGLLAAGGRAGTARPAPAHGLCLVSVDY